MQIALMSIAQIKMVRFLAKLTLLKFFWAILLYLKKINFLKGKGVEVQHLNWLINQPYVRLLPS